MASENNLNDATSFHQSDNPILCANGCGFFGTPATMNLCSKCYRDHKMHEEQAATAKAAVEKSMSSAPPSPKVLVVTEKIAEDPAAVEDVLVSETSASEEVVEKAVALVAPPPAKASNRCGGCNKKVGVMGFKCRCGVTFCRSHRYPEEHECPVDYKGAGKVAIAKANPVVKADKVERF